MAQARTARGHTTVKTPNRTPVSYGPQVQPVRKKKPKRGIFGITTNMDMGILTLTLILVGIGIIIVFDASYYSAMYSTTANNNPLFYFNKQLFGAAIGIVVMFGASLINYWKYRKLSFWILGFAILLLALVWIPGIGTFKNGARRWFDVFGVSVQPAEIFKPALIMYMASFLAANRDELHKFSVGVVPFLIILVISCVFIFLQPNVSTIFYICILTFMMMLLGGVRPKHLMVLVALAAVGVAALVIIDVFGAGTYRTGRYFAFVDPFADPGGDGFQLVQAQYAIASGGLFGKGFGQSAQKLLFMPYSESDMIFAIIAEEFGLAGCAFLIGIYGLLIARGLRVAKRCRDLYGSLLASGMTVLLGLQFLFHVSVVTGVVPPTGIPLPFISAGSTSLIIFMGAVGILLNISKHVSLEA